MEELRENDLGSAIKTNETSSTGVEKAKSTLTQFSRFFRLISKGKNETAGEETPAVITETPVTSELSEDKTANESAPSLEGILDQLHQLESCIAQWVHIAAENPAEQASAAIGSPLSPWQKWTIRLMAAGVTIFLGLTILFAWSSNQHKSRIQVVRAGLTAQINANEETIAQLKGQLSLTQQQLADLKVEMENALKQRNQEISQKSGEILRISKQLAKAQSEKEYLKVRIKTAEDVSLNLAGEKEKLASQIANRGSKAIDNPDLFQLPKAPKTPSQMALKNKKTTKTVRVDLDN